MGSISCLKDKYEDYPIKNIISNDLLAAKPDGTLFIVAFSNDILLRDDSLAKSFIEEINESFDDPGPLKKIWDYIYYIHGIKLYSENMGSSPFDSSNTVGVISVEMDFALVEIELNKYLEKEEYTRVDIFSAEKGTSIALLSVSEILVGSKEAIKAYIDRNIPQPKKVQKYVGKGILCNLSSRDHS